MRTINILFIFKALILLYAEYALGMDSCYECESRLRGRQIHHDPTTESCHHLGGKIKTVKCPGGCMAAHGVFWNGDESVERWCVNESSIADINALFTYVGLKKSRETKDGMKFACNNVYFDDTNNTERGAKFYDYCWCKGDMCNGNAINGMIRSGCERFRSFCDTSKNITILLILLIVLSKIQLVSGYEQVRTTELEEQYKALDKADKFGSCIACTERTNEQCIHGESLSSVKCTKGIHIPDSCVKFVACVSGMPCFVYRGCMARDLKFCMEGIHEHIVPNFAENKDECTGKHKFPLNTPQAANSLHCFLKLKYFYEDYTVYLNEGAPDTLKEPADSDHVLKAVSNEDDYELQIEYCHCSGNDCNASVTCIGMSSLVWSTAITGMAIRKIMIL